MVLAEEAIARSPTEIEARELGSSLAAVRGHVHQAERVGDEVVRPHRGECGHHLGRGLTYMAMNLLWIEALLQLGNLFGLGEGGEMPGVEADEVE
jgi:hypothetical protein